MQTFSVNALAMQFECDRATMQRALRNVPPDLVTGKRESFKVATAAKALERHRRSVGTSNGGRESSGPNPPEFAAFDRAYDAMKALPTLAKRRAAAVKLIPVITDMMAAMRAHGLASGEDPEVTGLRSDRVFQLTLAGFQEPCSWSHDEVWETLSV